MLDMNTPRRYLSKTHLDARMPLGGIGTGNIEIGADGRLTTWQLFNTLKDGEVPFYFLLQAGNVTRLLQTNEGPDWPRIKEIEMTGEYPLALLRYKDQELPVGLELIAFTPFSPLETDFSSLPLVAFIFRITNPGRQPVKASLAALTTNPVGYDATLPLQQSSLPGVGGNVNVFFRHGTIAGVFLKAEPKDYAATREPGFGTLCLATTGPNPSALTAFTHWDEAWQMFKEKGEFLPQPPESNSPTPVGETVNCALSSSALLPPGSSVEIPFLLTWHYPNKYASRSCNEPPPPVETPRIWIGNYYTHRWSDARAVVLETAPLLSKLYEKTEQFRSCFYDSTLPYWLLDCLTANSATIRHVGVVFRISRGDVYGWEGSNGCCTPTCTHVWGYEQTLARLFPDLEREMRRIEFFCQQQEDGGIRNRIEVPTPGYPTGEQPFADGHASCILKAYREALNSADETFFHQYWPRVLRAVNYLIARDAASHGQPAGYLEDDQWNTYDQTLHGVTTFISGYYLAALRAGEEWARRVGDSPTADRFRAIFQQGQKNLVKLCWNGEYFQQHLPDYLEREGEVGPGCMSDQLLGQWWAHQIGLGYILPQDLVKTALRSIFRYNFKSDLTGWPHAPRAFAGNKDKGLIVCTWPKGGRPAKVMLYSDEVWTGIEYQVAAHMIYEGLLEEGFTLVKAARDRYDGIPRPPITRNPWNEQECGGHYVRAMSSWSLLLALSGFECDGPAGVLRFSPRYRPHDFRSFFIGPQGWGSFAQKLENGIQEVTLTVKSGSLFIKTIDLAVAGEKTCFSPAVTIANLPLPVRLITSPGRAVLELPPHTIVRADQTLEIKLIPDRKQS